MAFAKEIYAAVNADFAQRREAALNLQGQRKDEAYGLFPRLLEIERLLSLTSLELASQVAAGGGVKESIAAIMKKNKELQEERQDILLAGGYDAGYLDIGYSCPECMDTGFIGSRMCACYEKALKKTAYEKSLLATAMPEARFENFHLDYYSDEPDETGIPPRERMESVLDFTLNFCREFERQKRSLLFLGATGLGKTFLSGCISRELTSRGKIVVYDTAYSIFSLLEKEKFNRDSEEADISALFDCDLLIMDDLGAEMQTAFTKSALYNLINTRLLKNKLTLISTNYSMTELEQIYTPRIISRIFGEYVFLRFAGEDIRQQLGFNQICL